MKKPASYFNDDIKYLKYGYYQVGDFKSLSKFEAWQHARDAGISSESIRFDFNSDLFSTIDWSIEPSESLDKLYANRARQLREKYDYIVLVYSGGIDSHVALQSFLKNGIKIDEIITLCNSLETGGVFNQEVFKFAVPYIDSLNLENLGTKFSLVDIGLGWQEQYNDLLHRRDFFYAVNGLPCPWNHYVRSGKLKIENFENHVELSKNNKKVGYVWGIDKPNLLLEDGYFVFKFVDVVPDFGVRKFLNDTIYKDSLSNIYDEPFYITRDAPEIVIKQCHMVANELNSMSSDDVNLVSVSNLRIGEAHIVYKIDEKDPSKTLLLSKKKLNQIIYPDAPHDKFGDDKTPGGVLYIKKDAWFYRQQTKVRNDLVAFLKQTVRENNGYFLYTADGVPDRPMRIMDNTVYRIKKKQEKFDDSKYNI
jgi:hypothetical protein